MFMFTSQLGEKDNLLMFKVTVNSVGVVQIILNYYVSLGSAWVSHARDLHERRGSGPWGAGMRTPGGPVPVDLTELRQGRSALRDDKGVMSEHVAYERQAKWF